MRGHLRGSRNRPAGLLNDTGNEVETDGEREGRKLRERMHATLAAGMPPAVVADLLADAIRRDARYLLTDHDWDERIRQRHEAISAAAAGPAAQVRGEAAAR